MSPALPTRFRPAALRLAALLGPALLGCRDPVDAAAKARIFSPEEPSRAVKEAAEALDSSGLASPALARRVLRMSAAEAAERLGTFKYEADAAFSWSLGKKGGTPAVALNETRKLLGGPHGDFQAIIDNDRDQGMEVIRAMGQVFARSKYERFRHRKRDRGQAEQQREEAYSALRTVYDLYGGRFALEKPQTVTEGGRQVVRYAVALSSQPFEPPADQSLPPVQYPGDGPNDSLKARIAFEEKKTCRKLSGKVSIDAKTGVPLAAELSGELGAPGEKGLESILSLKLKLKVSEVGADPKVHTPKDFLPDEGRPGGIAAALDRFGMPRKGRPEGGAPSEAEEPGDEEP